MQFYDATEIRLGGDGARVSCQIPPIKMFLKGGCTNTFLGSFNVIWKVDSKSVLLFRSHLLSNNDQQHNGVSKL